MRFHWLRACMRTRTPIRRDYVVVPPHNNTGVRDNTHTLPIVKARAFTSEIGPFRPIFHI